MKKLYFAIAAAVMALSYSSCLEAKAQTDSKPDECMLYMSYYQEYYKQGGKDSKLAAIPSWRKAYAICAPATRQNLYVHGAELYRMLISQNSKNPEYRSALIDTLITLHKLRAEYYPKYADKAYSALSRDVNNYLKNDPEKSYSILTEVVAKQAEKTEPVTFVAQMNAAVKLYKSGKLSAEEIINTYDVACNCFSTIQQTDTTQLTRNMRTTMENAFINSHVATCENLQKLFGDRFEESKDDYAMVSKIVKLLSGADDCTDNELFLKSVTAMHSLQPNANSAYYLYRLNNSKGNTSVAGKYLEEACAGEDLDNSTKAQYIYELSAYYLKNGSPVKAVENANKAIALDDSFAGKANMIIAHSWISVSCEGNEVERRAKYWVAVDYYTKAKAADSSLTEEANAQIASCRKYFPQTAEAFMYDVQNGQSYSVSCGGLHATTTVRTNQ